MCVQYLAGDNLTQKNFQQTNNMEPSWRMAQLARLKRRGMISRRSIV